jgi:hypothetical protein
MLPRPANRAVRTSSSPPAWDSIPDPPADSDLGAPAGGLHLKSLLAVAVALPGEFGAGLRVAGWRRSLPLCGAVRGQDG